MSAINLLEDLRPPTTREFRLFQSFVYDYAGIHLGETKLALLHGRLSRRVRELGLRSFAAYYDFVRQHPDSETVELLDRITTNETSFFRELRHFQLLEETIFPALRERNAAACRVRIWSAGCSTGEEPYSLAITAAQMFPPDWQVEIVASDLSARVLRQASDAVWPIARAEQLPKPLLKKYMLKGIGPKEGTFTAGRQIRSMIHFLRLNLNTLDESFAGPFDIIFCRNVLIYFDHDSKSRAVTRIVERLPAGGYLFVGHAESMAGLSERLKPIEPSVYVRL